jgi:response regulator NasT
MTLGYGLAPEGMAAGAGEVVMTVTKPLKPLDIQPATLTQAHPARGKLPDRPATVLVADDEHLVASGVAAILTDLGYQVVGPACDGEEALRLCERARPDLALLDIRMPGLDGLSAIFDRLGIPVMILSAYSDPEYVGSACRQGVFGYLLKPATHDQLRVAISIAWARFLDFAAQGAEIDNLRQRLENRKVVEQAKWVLVKRKGVEEPEAMRLLQRHARNNRRPIVEVARSILENEDLFEMKERE